MNQNEIELFGKSGINLKTHPEIEKKSTIGYEKS